MRSDQIHKGTDGANSDPMGHSNPAYRLHQVRFAKFCGNEVLSHPARGSARIQEWAMGMGIR